MEVSVPEGYNELLCDFSECYWLQSKLRLI
jgi:hypothetical protein